MYGPGSVLIFAAVIFGAIPVLGFIGRRLDALRKIFREDGGCDHE